LQHYLLCASSVLKMYIADTYETPTVSLPYTHGMTPNDGKRIVKNVVFWVVTPCGSCKNRRFRGTWRLLHQGDKIGELGTTLAATSNRRTL
jgi:hypothetical protein